MWISRVDARLTMIEMRLDSLSKVVTDGFAEVRRDIKALFQGQRTAVHSRSPVTLTVFGEEISAPVSAKKWADTHAPGLIENALDKEEFEVFEICVAYIRQLLESDAEFDRTVRFGAYQHGTETDQVKKVFEVELRDKVLELTSLGSPGV